MDERIPDCLIKGRGAAARPEGRFESLARRRLGYSGKWAPLRSDLFRVPGHAEQLGLAP